MYHSSSVCSCVARLYNLIYSLVQDLPLLLHLLCSARASVHAGYLSYRLCISVCPCHHQSFPLDLRTNQRTYRGICLLRCLLQMLQSLSLLLLTYTTYKSSSINSFIFVTSPNVAPPWLISRSSRTRAASAPGCSSLFNW